jgi:translation initiation factor 6
MLGIFGRANSNGIVLSNIVYEEEIRALGRPNGVNAAVIESDLNAVGNNIMANDKVAFINPEYSPKAAKEISDVLGVEVFPMKIGYFKTLGATNILTNKGMALNNTVSDEQKERIEEMLGIKTIRTTANTGSLNIGIATLANSSGILVGSSTTGFELARLMQTLE